MSDPLGAHQRPGPVGPIWVGLVALFVAAWVTAQVLAAKVLGFGLGATVPILGPAITVPAGVLAYAITFFATDCVSELYGKRAARLVVNGGFGAILAMIVLIWLALAAPSARALGIPAGVDPAAFRTVLGFTPGIVLGSVVAYLLSQNWDVVAFHAIRDRTGADRLWLRNIGSTATSQLIDTVIFILIAFWLAPTLLGVGEPSPPAVLGSLIAGQYLVKLLIALADTPVVYAVVASARAG